MLLSVSGCLSNKVHVVAIMETNPGSAMYWKRVGSQPILVWSYQELLKLKLKYRGMSKLKVRQLDKFWKRWSQHYNICKSQMGQDQVSGGVSVTFLIKLPEEGMDQSNTPSSLKLLNSTKYGFYHINETYNTCISNLRTSYGTVFKL